jgi:hypothetical protein
LGDCYLVWREPVANDVGGDVPLQVDVAAGNHRQELLVRPLPEIGDRYRLIDCPPESRSFDALGGRSGCR